MPSNMERNHFFSESFSPNNTGLQNFGYQKLLCMWYLFLTQIFVLILKMQSLLTHHGRIIFYTITSFSEILKFTVDFVASTIIFIIFCDFLMFYQIFLLPQVKWCAIITNKHGIYEWPHELPNDLRFRILGN